MTQQSAKWLVIYIATTFLAQTIRLRRIDRLELRIRQLTTGQDRTELVDMLNRIR